MHNYTMRNLKQSSRVKFWRRNFALKILCEILRPCSPILCRDFYGRLICDICVRFIVLKFYFG
ncbi:hypothetical protein [uncultured Campylobacter sp.]|uniref:hypothetical protein n=1 Tax=uncultured Campylobacter sp. TaxID=218934 RepID=UPI002632FECF|nr:hypothetical protein [uncultured Campylobacter sp.]